MTESRPDSHTVRKQRYRLWRQQEKRCYWCGKRTVLPEALLRRYVPLDDIYAEGMADQVNHLINQLKAKDEHFRVTWQTKLATVDHLVEHARGGSHDDSNIVMACLPCNQERGIKFNQNLDSDGRAS